MQNHSNMYVYSFGNIKKQNYIPYLTIFTGRILQKSTNSFKGANLYPYFYPRKGKTLHVLILNSKLERNFRSNTNAKKFILCYRFN